MRSLNEVPVRMDLRARLMFIVLRVGLSGISGYVLWQALFFVLAADRGLDLTDEGLYLLAARPPSLSAAWGTPSGWHTAPLFRAVGYDVAAFRTLGAFLLVTASGLLGFLAVSVGQGLRVREMAEGGSMERLVGALLGGLGGLLYYGGLVRTPSYNWVTVLGATVAGVGILLMMLSQLPRQMPSPDHAVIDSSAHSPLYAVGVATVSFGAFFTLPAKPTTAVFLAVLAVPMLRLVGGARFLLVAFASVTGTAVGFLIAAIAFRFWPVNFPSVFLWALEAPAFLPEQRLSGALLTIPAFPVAVIRDAWTLSSVVAIFTFIALTVAQAKSARIQSVLTRRKLMGCLALVVIAVLSLARRTLPTVVATVYSVPIEKCGSFIMKNRTEVPVEAYISAAENLFSQFLPLVGGSVVGIMLLLVNHRVRFAFLGLMVTVVADGSREILSLVLGGPARTHFVRQELTRGAFVAGLGLLVLASGMFRSGLRRERLSSHPGGSRLFLAAVALWLIGVSTGFGSGHGLVRQAALSAGILVSGLLLGAAMLSNQTERWVGMLLVVVLVLPAIVLQVASNLRTPYRMESIRVQTVNVPVGADGAILRLDEDLARLMLDLTTAARAAGWEPETPLLGVASRWTSTLVWHLGATVPDSLMLTIGGYGAESTTRLDFSLERYVDDRFESSWILVSAENHPTRIESLEWAGRAAETVGRSFPGDYSFVYRSEPSSNRWVSDYGSVELWRPKVP